jgi:hypothetical protein
MRPAAFCSLMVRATHMRIIIVSLSVLWSTIAVAQTVQIPRGGGGGTPPIVLPPAGGSPGGGAMRPPEAGLSGSLPAVKPAPQVKPPPPAAKAAPDAGDSNACDCYVTDQIPIVGPNGRTIWQQSRRPTGRKALECCRR